MIQPPSQKAESYHGLCLFFLKPFSGQLNIIHQDPICLKVNDGNPAVTMTDSNRVLPGQNPKPGDRESGGGQLACLEDCL